jgi:hypothetical protein
VWRRAKKKQPRYDGLLPVVPEMSAGVGEKGEVLEGPEWENHGDKEEDEATGRD